MQVKQFHLGEVLSVTTRRLVSPIGVCNIMSFMVGYNLFQHEFPQAGEKCRPWLVAQFPQLSANRMGSALAELDNMLKAKTSAADEEEVIAGWLAKQVDKYGEMLSVNSIPSRQARTR
jgi:hypothetical protein